MKSKKFKFLLLSFTIVYLIIAIFLGIIISRNINTKKNNYSYLNNESNKVILFIGDGMGENHIKISSLFLNIEPIFNSFNKDGYVTTFSKNLFIPTDSAAAATALATGKKVNNKEIAYHKGEYIDSISDYAKSQGYGVGIVTTDSLAGATPAAFSSNASNRSNTDEIINSQLTSNIDLFLGSGSNTYAAYKDMFMKSGYTYIDRYTNLTLTNKKLIGVFSKINNYTSDKENPTLPILTEYAINYFEKNFPNGYFIMVEAAHIDKMSHDNNIYDMIKYFDEFNNSIKIAYEKLSSYSKTSIIVTADHETGNLKETQKATNVTNDLYRSSGHTSKKVKYYMYNKNNIFKDVNKKIDNTDIYKICKALLNNN